MKISIFGLGYVGAVSCGCLAKLGHEVVGVDVSKSKVDLVNSGRPPVVEPQLDDLLASALERGVLRATTDANEAIEHTEAAFVCVGTPSTASGGVDDRHLVNVTEQIAHATENRDRPFTLIVRSTCLPPVHQKLRRIICAAASPVTHYVYHPEFLRECAAVDDFFDPPKIVFGVDSDVARQTCEQLYPGIQAPTFWTSVDVASMVKYADNCFHAVKVTFGNEIGTMCHEFGVNSREVMDVFCADTKLNISSRYFMPGAPYGGSCLPKDLRAILDAARIKAVSVPMLQGSMDSNLNQIEQLLGRVSLGDRQPVGIIGLAFKEGTDDLRESPALRIVERLTGKGHPIAIYDEHLAVGKLVGRNRSFALETIPHLKDWVISDLQAVIDSSRTLIVTHRLSRQRWNTVNISEDCCIVDTIGVDALKNHPGYRGLYW